MNSKRTMLAGASDSLEVGVATPTLELEGSPPTTEATIFDILPEIWPKILQHLTPVDFHSLINSSPTLRECLESERTNRLLPLVLPLLTTNQQGIDWNAYLTLRQVNRATNIVVGNLLEEESSPSKYWEKLTTHMPVWTDRVGDGDQKLAAICKQVRVDYDIGQNRRYSQPIPKPSAFVGGFAIRNPFLAHSLEIHFKAFDPKDFEDFLCFMGRHGQNLTYLKCNLLRTLRIVLSVLPHVPNLRILKLFTEDRVEDQDEFVNPISYPLLPNLEFLDMEGFYDHRDQTNIRLNIAFIRKYGLQLKGLNCSNRFFQGWWGLGNFFSRNLSNLQRLRVAKVGQHALSALSTANLPALEELHLVAESSVYFRSNNLAKFQLVFDVVNNCGTNLSSLQLYVWFSEILSETSEYNGYKSLREGSMIPLPKLTTFGTCLANVHLDWFWPFIQLKCPNLEELTLQAMDCYKLEDDPELNRLLQKKGFELAPKLRRISIVHGITTRRFGPKCNPHRIEITRGGIQRRNLWTYNTVNE